MSVNKSENTKMRETLTRKDLKEEFIKKIENQKKNQSKEGCVFNYYGEPGGGKSWFGGELKKQAQEEGYTVVELDFSSGEMDREKALESLALALKESRNEKNRRMVRALKEIKPRWLVLRKVRNLNKIDFWRLGVAMRQLGRDWNTELVALEKGYVVLIALGLVTILTYVLRLITGGVIAVIAANAFLGLVGPRTVVEWVSKFALRKKCKKDDERLAKEKDWNQFKKQEVRKRLPELFAEDVNEWLSYNPDVTLCIFVDSYDEEKNGWICDDQQGLCRYLKQAFFAIMSEKNLVEKDEKKPEKDEKSISIIPRKVGRPTEKETYEFLEDKKVLNKMWKPLYQQTFGWPELLDKWCERFAPGNKGGKLSDVELDRLAKWAKAFIEEHQHVKLPDSVYLMAGMQRWTDDTLKSAMWATGVGISDDVADIVKKLGSVGLITRDRDGVYSMGNKDNRDIRDKWIREREPEKFDAEPADFLGSEALLVRNTILSKDQRKNAYAALLGENTASGAEAAYYLGSEALWPKEQGYEDLWSGDLAVQLQLHALALVDAVEKQEQAPNDAQKHPFLSTRNEEMQKEQQKKIRQELRERANGLFEKAAEIYDKIAKVDNGKKNVLQKLIVKNYWAKSCNSLGRPEDALKIANEVLEELKRGDRVVMDSKGNSRYDDTKKPAMENKCKALNQIARDSFQDRRLEDALERANEVLKELECEVCKDDSPFKAIKKDALEIKCKVLNNKAWNCYNDRCFEEALKIANDVLKELECEKCEVCEDDCPFKAIKNSAERVIIMVEEALLLRGIWTAKGSGEKTCGRCWIVPPKTMELPEAVYRKEGSADAICVSFDSAGAKEVKKEEELCSDTDYKFIARFDPKKEKIDVQIRIASNKWSKEFVEIAVKDLISGRNKAIEEGL